MVTFISHIWGLLELNDLRLCTNMTPLTQNQTMYDHYRCHAFYKRSPCGRIVVHVTLSMTPLESKNLKCIARLRKGIVYAKCRNYNFLYLVHLDLMNGIENSKRSPSVSYFYTRSFEIYRSLTDNSPTT